MKKFLLKLLLTLTTTSFITSCNTDFLKEADNTNQNSNSNNNSSSNTSNEDSSSSGGGSSGSSDNTDNTDNTDTTDNTDDTDKTVAVTSISIDPTSLTLAIGETSAINYEVLPSDATDKGVSFSSSNESVATVNQSGNVSALKEGSTTITITSNSNLAVSSVCSVTVVKPTITSFSLNLSNTFFTIDESKIITMSYSPYNADSTYVKWLSSDTSVASVTSSGVVTAKSAGTCNISVYDDLDNDSALDSTEVSSQLTITVNKSTELSLSSKDVKIYSSLSGATYYTISEYERYNIPIYKTNFYGEVPYIEGSNIRQLVGCYYNSYVNNYDFIANFESKGNSIYRYIPYNYGTKLNYYLEFNASENTITAYKWSYYIDAFYFSDGYPGEVASPTGIVAKSPDSSTYLVEPNDTVVFNLDDYDIHLVEKDSKLYIPLYLLYKLVFIDSIAPFYYNGNDELYPCGNSSNTSIPFSLFPYFYSSSNGFYLNLNNVSSTTLLKMCGQTPLKEVTPTISNAIYQYEGIRSLSDIGRSDKAASILVLYEDGSAKYCCGLVAGSTNPSTSKFSNWIAGTDTSNMTSRSFTYNKINDNIIKLVYNSTYEYYIRTNYESNYALNSFEEGMQEFNYNLLCFNLDYFYGIRYDMGVTSFDTYFKNTTASIIISSNETIFRGKNDTIYNHYYSCTTMDEYSVVLSYILTNCLGDGHTAYQHMPVTSNFNSYVCDFGKSLNQSTRYKGLMETVSELSSLRNSALGSSNMIQFYDNNKTAVLRFDSFVGGTISQKTSYTTFYDSSKSISSQYNSIVGSQAVQAIYGAMAYIKSSLTDCKNIVFDLSINGGGVVLQIPQLLALMTDDPAIIIKNAVDQGITEFHYKVDLNGDGTYGGSGDTFKGEFNFFVLVSEFSFSCGTAFPSMCKNIGCATIIGDEHSGGGACSVGQGGDCFGSHYRISSSNIITLKEEGYPSDDKGVTSSKVIDRSNWYSSSITNYLS